MGGFRRLVLFVFSLAGLACLAALALPWYGLYTEQIAELEAWHPYVLAVEVCLVMTVAWLAWNLLRALFSRRRVSSIAVMDIEGGAITVAKSAVASQASHVVEESGLGVAKHVEVHARKRGPVDVEVRVTPFESIDVTEQAPVLHAALTSGLAAMCGERLGAVNVEFLEPRDTSSLADVDYDEDDEEEFTSPFGVSVSFGGSSSHGEDNAKAEAAEDAADTTGDITIPMRAEKED